MKENFQKINEDQILPNLNILKNIDNIKGYLLTLLANLFLSIAYFLFKKYTNSNYIYPETLISYRGFFFSIISLIYIFSNFQKMTKFNIYQMKSLILRAAINGVFALIVIFALQNLRVNTLEMILRSGNIMSLYLGYIILNEKVTIYDFYVLLSTILGAILILKPVILFGSDNVGGEDHFIGIIYALASAFLSSLAVVLNKKLSGNFDEMFTILLMGLMGCFVGIIFSQIGKIDIAITYYDMLGLGLTFLIEFLGYFLNMIALKYETVTKLTPFYNCRILYSVVFVYFSSGAIDYLDILGIFVIIFTYIYISYKKIKLLSNNK